jgi:hypothetical protein
MTTFDEAHAAGFKAAMARFNSQVHAGVLERALSEYLAHVRPVLERQAAEAMRKQATEEAHEFAEQIYSCYGPKVHEAVLVAESRISNLPLPGDPT